LFNPALLDLTGLPAEFLAMRPSLLSVLDAMHDRNMIPEPKDYRSWRRQRSQTWIRRFSIGRTRCILSFETHITAQKYFDQPARYFGVGCVRFA